ncbi:YfiR family protein [Chryseolinea sp. H1M3-3]|uniref:YfiR family protein n=1 Tax=Chryseolinea sp. H1M3-3 TaxID=3034144 RepID=UPI0023EC497D|nr:YfiR family protein [Chryseolinea sp. H1M3-3]
MKKSIFLMLMVAATTVTAQDRPTHEIHAAMLFNFIKYVQWPNEGEPGEFVVGVIGDDNVFNTLSQWYNGKPKGSKKYVIKKLTSADESSTCQVVYVGKSKNKEFENIKSSIEGKSILTITDGNGLGQKGSCINFKVIDGKLKFELNQATLTGSNLKVSTQLSSMAILI